MVLGKASWPLRQVLHFNYLVQVLKFSMLSVIPFYAIFQECSSKHFHWANAYLSLKIHTSHFLQGVFHDSKVCINFYSFMVFMRCRPNDFDTLT